MQWIGTTRPAAVRRLTRPRPESVRRGALKLFRNMTYTGATISNFLLNATAGILIVAMMLVQVGGGMTAQEAGFLTIGYAIAIVAFIRVGEKLLQRFGPRRPMIWGSLIVGAAIACLLPTNPTLGTYKVLAA